MHIESLMARPMKLSQPAFCNLSKDSADDSIDLPARRLGTFLINQVEFYLSDANLIRDKFMRSKVAQNRKGFIDLAVFAKCNKVIQAMESYEIPKNKYFEVLADALVHSKTLKLNKLKNMVKRRAKFDEQLRTDSDVAASIDARSVYVDNFPSPITEEELHVVFEKCGQISFISLPKYESDCNKGHALIEFVDSQGASNALKLNNKSPEYFTTSGRIKGPNLRVIHKLKWIEIRQRLSSLKERLKADLTKNYSGNNTKNYVIKLILRQTDIVDEAQVKLSLTQLDVFPAHIHFNQERSEVTVRLTDYDQAQRLETACYHRNELLSFVSKHRKISDNELDGYLKALRKRRLIKRKKNQKSQNDSKRKTVKS